MDVVHGDVRVDEYHWLRDKGNPDVAAHLEAENAHTAAVMKPTEALQQTLYEEMLGRIQETDLSVPYRDGAYWYYSRTEEGKQYPILCRKAGPSAHAPEEVTLDLNVLAEGQPYLSLGVYAVSDDGRLLAYSTDTTGFRAYTLFVKDLATGERLPFKVENSGAVAWASDNRTLFYATEDDAKRPYRVWRHRLGEASSIVVFEETDERFRVSLGRTRSRAYVLLVSGSHTTTEWRFLPSDQSQDWRMVSPRRHEHEYDVDHHGGLLLIRTNDRGRNCRLVSAPVSAPGEESWVEVVPHRADVMLEAVEVFRRHFVLLERQDGLPRLTVRRIADGETHAVAFPEPTYSVFPAANAEFDTVLFRYSYESLVAPRSVFDYDMEARTSTLLKEQPVLGGYDRTRYASERVFATSPDGVRVPISIVYRKDRFPRDGAAPLLLTAYGSYGYPLPVTFSSNRLSLLDRGVGFAMAHIRGGGDMGKPWHDDGRMMMKKNTFIDFIAAASHLLAEAYTSSDRLVIEGGSAGGLLMGAVANMRPELFKAVVSRVPFVDVVNTMLDESLPLTVGEFEEWGNPKVKQEYDYIKTYCPYTNLEKKAYPAMLVKTSFNDSQVMYWEPAKYVAKLRTLKTDDNVLLLHTNMKAGHGGASGRYDYLREIAFDYAFVLARLDLTA